MDDVSLDGRVVLVRVDFNVSIGDDGIVDRYEDYRIQTAIPTIEELLQRRCKVVLLTHLGRPREGRGSFDLAPIQRRLEELMHDDVRVLKHLFGDDRLASENGAIFSDATGILRSLTTAILQNGTGACRFDPENPENAGSG